MERVEELCAGPFRTMKGEKSPAAGKSCPPLKENKTRVIMGAHKIMIASKSFGSDLLGCELREESNFLWGGVKVTWARKGGERTGPVERENERNGPWWQRQTGKTVTELEE